MEEVDKVLDKLKEARKEKDYSHENRANELDISQSTYTNLERNETGHGWADQDCRDTGKTSILLL